MRATFLATIFSASFLPLWGVVAAPQPVAVPTTDLSYESDARSRNIQKCTIFDPPNLTSSIEQCKTVCGNAVAANVAKGQTASITCSAFEKNIQWQQLDSRTKVAGANCSCNNSFIDELADDFVKTLPAIGEIGCQIIMAAVNLVVEVGALAIPGVGEAIDGGMIAGIEAAKLAAYAYDAGDAAFGAFSNWLNPCGSTSAVPEDLQKVFNTLQSVNVGVLPKGFKPGKVPQGKGQPGDAGDPKGKPNPSPPKATDPTPPKTNEPIPTRTDDPNSKPNTTIKPTTTVKPTTTDQTTSTSKACRQKSKRNDSEDDCRDETVTSTIITSTLKLEDNLVGKTCSVSKYPQACYHYYSVSRNMYHNDGNFPNTYRCGDGYSGRDMKQVRSLWTATADWTKQHKNKVWQSYTADMYVKYDKPNDPQRLECHADEYPPVALLPRKDSAEQQRANYGQMVRWVPATENTGAGNLWRGFCGSNDGGSGNGQYRNDDDKNGKFKKGDLNLDLVKPSGVPDTKQSHVGDDKTTTVTAKVAATIKRGVFSMTFDFAGAKIQEAQLEAQSWGLKDNPCWPSYIVADDPGYPILTSDRWYEKQGQPDDKQKDLTKYYSEDPPADRLNRAKQAKDEHRPPTPAEEPPSAKKPKTGGSKRHLQLVDDGTIAIRDVNVTRRITEEEMKSNVEVIDCADHDCKRERRAIGVTEESDGWLLIKGEPPSPTPAVVDAGVNTALAARATTMEKFVRRSYTDDIPAITPPASLGLAS